MNRGPKLTFTVEYRVSDETITDMLDAAGYGMTYWASSMEFKATGDQQYIEVTDHDDKVYKATYVALREAFGKLVDPAQDYVGRTIHDYFRNAVEDRDRDTDEIDAGHIDSDAGDVWVQVALWDKVIYG